MTDNLPRLRPCRVEWSAPEGWIVWSDEDGAHIRTSSGHCLEMCDVERLFAIWQAARDMSAAGVVPAPKPPTPEEIASAGHPWREEHEKRRAIRAIAREFATDATAPF